MIEATMHPFRFVRGLCPLATAASALLLVACAGPQHPAKADNHYAPAVSAITILKTSRTSAGQTIPYPHPGHPEVTGLLVTIPPGKETGWHKHTCPGYAYVLEGELIVRSEDGIEHKYRAGEAFAEMVQKAHNGQNRSRKSVRLVAFFTGEENKPITEKTR